ncbi:MAG: PilN domain-containing protein [Bacillota bacterium]
MRTAAKDFNFLPERILLARQKRKQNFIGLVSGLLFLAVLGGAVWFPFKVARGYQSSLDSVRREISLLDPAKPFFEEKEALQKDLSKKELAIKDIEGKQQKITDIIRKIDSILPRGCYVSFLSVKAREEMSIKVVTNDPVDTARILVGLRKLEMFKKVELAAVPDVPFTAGPREVEFNLVFIGASENKDKEKEKNPKGESSEAGKKVDNTAGKTQKLEEARPATNNR